MRVIIVDHDSTMLEGIVRALRDHFVIDVVSNKAHCIDLLRQNEFDLIVACERLEDGSGLELLGQAAKRWPATLRVFAAERERLQQLQGRLEPFELFQALSYPINPEKLLSTLTLAREAHRADADTTSIQHIVLGGEDPAEAPPPAPAPAPVAVAAKRSTMPSQPIAGGARQMAAPSARRPVRLPMPPTQPAPTRSVPPASNSAPPRATAAGPSAPAPRRSAETSPAARDSLAEAAAIAAAARAARMESTDSAVPSSRKAFIAVAGCGLALAAIGAVIWQFGAHPRAALAPVPAVVTAPQFSKEVSDQVAQVEADFEQDDLTRAQVDVRKLQAMAPDHPRLRFFVTLLDRGSRRLAEAAARSASQPTGSSRSGQRKTATSVASSAAPDPRAAGLPPPSTASATRSLVTQPSPGTERPTAGTAFSGRTVEDSSTASANSNALPGAAAASDTVVASAASAAGTSAAPSGTPAAPSVTSAAPPGTSAALSGTPAAPPGTSATLSGNPAPAAPTAETPSTSPAASLSDSERSSASSATSASATPMRVSARVPEVTAEAQLTHRVPPAYPDEAARKGVQGYVDLHFTITSKGTVTDVAVVSSDPADVFNHAATEAVRHWRYDPRVVDGQPVDSQSQVRLQFKLDAGSLSH